MAGKDKSRKRAQPDDSPVAELEIDVNAAEPLSKRAARRVKKGRTLKQAPSSKKEFDDINEGSDDDESDAASTSAAPPKSKTKTPGSEHTAEEPKKGTNGIWIGNLSFRTTETDLTTFFTTLKPLGKEKKASEYAPIVAADVVRISLPMAEKKGQNKGFAYVDFATPEQQETAIALSERILQSRNVLIKAADSFEGRPTAKPAVEDEKATKILYIGNLPFDVTSPDLESYLGGKEAGIRKVRMATFEDTGKCKGFAFVDFMTADQVKSILSNKKLHTMNGRKLKMEYGEDRSLRRKPHVNSASNDRQAGRMAHSTAEKVDARSITPGSALVNAHRASVGIVASAGQKTSFD